MFPTGYLNIYTIGCVIYKEEEVLIGRPGHKRRRILWDVRFNPHCALFKALLLANLHQPPSDQQLGWEPQQCSCSQGTMQQIKMAAS